MAHIPLIDSGPTFCPNSTPDPYLALALVLALVLALTLALTLTLTLLLLFDSRANTPKQKPYPDIGHSNRVFCVKYKGNDPNVILSAGWDNTIQVRAQP